MSQPPFVDYHQPSPHLHRPIVHIPMLALFLLSCSGEDPGDHAHRGVGHVGVVEHDVGALAAEFQGGADEP